MTAEIWKAVPGFEDLYEVSDHGRVRSLDREVVSRSRWGGTVIKQLRGRILRPGKNPNGYLFVFLGAGNIRLVHRLVAQAFLPNPEQRPTVNHINGKRDDARLANLEWATVSENNAHAYARGRSPSHARAVQVSQGGVGSWFPSVSEAARALGWNLQGFYWALANTGRYSGFEVTDG